jgi:hypothetical protein
MLVKVGDVSLAYRFVIVGLSLQIFQQLTALVGVMNELDRLFEGDGDDEADDDRGDVDEEVAPGGWGRGGCGRRAWVSPSRVFDPTHRAKCRDEWATREIDSSSFGFKLRIYGREAVHLHLPCADLRGSVRLVEKSVAVGRGCGDREVREAGGDVALQLSVQRILLP